MITQERLKEVMHYDPETGLFTRLVATARQVKLEDKVGTVDRDGYIITQIDGKGYRAHRLAWFYMTGEWPKHLIDHRDLNTSNNAWSNLREATHSQNNANKVGRRKRSQALKGIYFTKGKYQAQIGINGKVINLGRYITAEEAHAAYVKAAQEAFGEFARAA